MAKTVLMSKDDLLKEHTKLIHILKYGTHAEQVKEANAQAREMRKYK